jgi:hypothetical protein
VVLQVALLLRGAGERTPALERLSEAACLAAQAGDDAEGRRLAALAHEWLDDAGVGDVHPLRVTVATADARVDYYALRYDQALDRIHGALEMAERLGGAKGTIAARVVQAAILVQQRRYRACERVIRELAADRVAELTPLHHMHLCFSLVDLAATRDDLDAVLRHAHEAVEWGRKHGVRWRMELTVLNLADVHLARGEAAEAAALIDPLQEKDDAGKASYNEGEILETRARLVLLRGDAAGAREMITRRARRVELLGDRWRLTALRLVQALCSLELDPPSARREVVLAFIEAFQAVAHEEAFTIVGMDWLARGLDERGEVTLADEVRALATERRRAAALGWQE